MSLEVTVDLAGYPKGQVMGINGLGRVENGETVTLDDDQELAFVTEHGKSVREAFKDQEGVTVKGRGKYDAEDLPEVSDTAPNEPEVEAEEVEE